MLPLPPLPQEEPVRAHAAVVTLPLNVLKWGKVQFEPPLAEFKQQAMQGLDVGTENRVAMLFSKVGRLAHGWVYLSVGCLGDRTAGWTAAAFCLTPVDKHVAGRRASRAQDCWVCLGEL